VKSKISFLLIIISLSLFSFIPTEIKTITWSDLSLVNYRRVFSPVDGFYDKPFFNKSIQKLHGDQVQITGYVIPIDTYGEKFFLSAQPNSSCYFCGAGEQHEVIELRLKDLPANYKMDNYLTFKGTMITYSQANTLPYALDNAELVK